MSSLHVDSRLFLLQSIFGTCTQDQPAVSMTPRPLGTAPPVERGNLADRYVPSPEDLGARIRPVRVLVKSLDVV